MDPKYFRTVHLAAIGASIGLLLVAFFVKAGRVEHIPPEKWFVPFIVGVIFLGMEYLIQRKPR
jgi:hypothetical protein